MSRENETIIPWYLRIAAFPFIVGGAAVGAIVKPVIMLRDKLKGR